MCAIALPNIADVARKVLGRGFENMGSCAMRSTYGTSEERWGIKY